MFVCQRTVLFVIVLLCAMLLLLKGKGFADSEPGRKFAVTLGVGANLAAIPRPSAVDDFESQYGVTFKQKISRMFPLQLEYFLPQKFSLFVEIGFTTYSGEGEKAVLLGGYGTTLYIQDYTPITANVRWSFRSDGFVPFLNAGVGVAPGERTWNVTDSGLLGIVAQTGGGFRYFFGRHWGIVLEAKYSYILNTKEIVMETDSGRATFPAEEANIGLVGLMGGIMYCL